MPSNIYCKKVLRITRVQNKIKNLTIVHGLGNNNKCKPIKEIKNYEKLKQCNR